MGQGTTPSACRALAESAAESLGERIYPIPFLRDFVSMRSCYTPKPGDSPFSVFNYITWNWEFSYLIHYREWKSKPLKCLNQKSKPPSCTQFFKHYFKNISHSHPKHTELLTLVLYSSLTFNVSGVSRPVLQQPQLVNRQQQKLWQRQELSENSCKHTRMWLWSSNVCKRHLTLFAAGTPP